MSAERPATAEGEIGRTPLAHLLVYAVDRRLTGAMFFREPSGVEHIVQLVRGAPVKVRSGDEYARLGEILIEEGLISAQTLQDALAARGGLLGDVLLLSGCIDGATLDWMAEVQLVRRMVRLFELPQATIYRYFDEHDALADWGGDPVTVDPLAILWAGLREHGDLSARLSPTLARLGAARLRVHPAMAPGRFGFRQAELLAIARLREGEPTLSELAASQIVPEPTLRRLVYTLVITRSLDLGSAAAPVGVGEAQRSAAAAAALARVQLRSTAHRVGAAAPDPAGDGERGSPLPRVRRKEGVTTKPPRADPGAAPQASAPESGHGAEPRAAEGEGEEAPVSSLSDVPPSSLQWMRGAPARSPSSDAPRPSSASPSEPASSASPSEPASSPASPGATDVELSPEPAEAAQGLEAVPRGVASASEPSAAAQGLLSGLFKQ